MISIPYSRWSIESCIWLTGTVQSGRQRKSLRVPRSHSCMAHPLRWSRHLGVSSWSAQKRSSGSKCSGRGRSGAAGGPCGCQVCRPLILVRTRKTHMFDILQYPFIQNALLAGSCVAVVAAIVGYFMVVRGLTFAGHALPNIGFAGAAGAVLLGIDPVIGLFAFTIGAAIGIGILGKRLNERDTTIGIIMTFTLGLGILFLSLYAGYAERVYSILFGQIVGISPMDVQITAVF